MIQHVKADSLADVFDGSISTFTSYAINKGVNSDSIIYITCGPNDTSFGSQYVEGSNWIWAKGKMFGGGNVISESIDTVQNIELNLASKQDVDNLVPLILSM